MVSIMTVKNGKLFHREVTDNWFNVYLSRARFENLPLHWLSENSYRITIKGQDFTVTSDRAIDNR